MFAKKMNWILVCGLAILASVAVNSNALAADREIVSFHLPTWKSAHFDEANSAETNLKTFKQIGCEAVASQHGGHYDIRYRCVEWHSIAFNSHEQTHQWERWLKAYGFETSHRH